MKSPLIHFIGAVLLLIAAFGAYGGWYHTLSTKSQEAADAQNKIDEASKNVSRIALARAALAEIADDEASVRSYFVPETGVVAFINELEHLGATEKSQLTVLSVSTAGSASQPILQLSLSISGSFDAVMRTVGAVEYAPYDLSITKLSVTGDDKKLWHADVSLTVGSAPTATTTSTAK